MFTLCLNTSTVRTTPLLDVIPLARAAGFEAIEIWVANVHEHIGRGGEVRDIERALADHGLRVPSMIALGGWGDADENEWPHARDECRRRMELAARFGAPYIVATPPRAATDRGRIADRYGELLALGRECGVRPLLEYISFFRSLSRPEDAWAIVREARDPSGALVLDAFHTWNGGSSLRAIEDVPGDRILHYHIDDAPAEPPPGKQLDRDRVLPGDGVIDLVAELRYLGERGYSGALSLELFREDLWKRDPGEVLRDGAERVRRIIARSEAVR